jgi:hypothetical protein
MKHHIPRAVLQIGGTFLVSIPLVLLGLVIVPLGLLFRRTLEGTRQPFRQYPGEWVSVRLPDCWPFRWWDNAVDGFAGDKRGWWHDHQAWTGGAYTFLSMFIWGALRNTVNYWRRFVIACPVDHCVIETLAGNADVDVNANGHTRRAGNGTFAWAFLRAADKESGKAWYAFNLVLPWTKAEIAPDGAVARKGRCLWLRLGWEVKPEHAGMTFDTLDHRRLKPFEFRVNPLAAYD